MSTVRELDNPKRTLKLILEVMGITLCQISQQVDDVVKAIHVG